MNYNKYLNQKIINKNGEEGIITTFNENYLVIKYKDGEKTYSPDVAIKNMFIFFLDKELQKEINDNIKRKEDETHRKQREFEDNHKRAVALSKKVNTEYQELIDKCYVLQQLFGKDFVYPPYVRFVKRYKYILVRH